jgi:hypothetical protein
VLKLSPLLPLVVLVAGCGGHSTRTTSHPSPAPLTASASASPSAATVVRAYVCEPPAYKPSSLLIACGDGNARVTGLHWSSWTATSAVGTGIWQQNDCKPYCAKGRFHDFPVQLRLDDPMPGQGTMIFGNATAIFSGAAPDGATDGREPLMRNGAYAP